jgi:hypothetical protein
VLLSVPTESSASADGAQSLSFLLTGLFALFDTEQTGLVDTQQLLGR